MRDWESSERDKDRPKPVDKPKPEEQPDDEDENNYDQDTGEPLKPGFRKPQQSNQWHTSQQVGYKPTKPSKDNDDDIVDVEPKPNKPLRIKEKITIVKDPAKATGIQRTGGITHGSVYAGKPLPQSLQQKLNPADSSAPVRAVDAKGRTQQQWVKLVKAKFPDAKIMQAKMMDGPVFAMLPDGRKLSWNKVEKDVAEASLGNYREKALKQKAQSQMGAMFNDPDALATFNKRERGLNRLKARDEVARKTTADKQMADNIAKLPELKADYERMKAEYKSLGGSNWQYADREQNLTDRERKARSMEGPMNNLWRTISAAEKAQKSQGVEEASKMPFAGAKVGHKEGPAGQWRNDSAKKNKPARPGDLVGDGT
jgi:hypothetical protein